MGKPGGGNAPSPIAEHIGYEEGTRGTETSKYPQEEKETSISLVAASEQETAQTGSFRASGVVDRHKK